jgi:hypothetical protein
LIFNFNCQGGRFFYKLNPEEIMIQKEITLCGKQVNLAYCYATEISYKILSDEDIIDFGQEVVEKIQHEQMPDIRKTIYLILASMQSYYESKGETCPITDKELMYECTPQEIGMALGTIIGLRTNFYHVPSDEPKDKPAEGKEEKNA